MSKLQTTTLSIFPGLENRIAVFLNLDNIAAAARHQPARSPFLNPRLTDRFLTAAHRKLGVDYSLGGYLEDRRHLWRGSYLDENAAVHLGIDINLPAGTTVSVAQPSRVAAIVHDTDQDGGWGTAVIFALAAPVGGITHFIYAHLGRNTIRVQSGDLVMPGMVVGALGAHHENGFWYEHLHVQAVTAAGWDRFQGDLKKIDGYAPAVTGKIHPLYPDPLPLL